MIFLIFVETAQFYVIIKSVSSRCLWNSLWQGQFVGDILHVGLSRSSLAVLWSFVKIMVDIKGTVAWDFLSKVISPKVPNCSSDPWSKAVSNIDSNSPRNSTFKVFPRYGPLRRVFLCAMGHYGGFCCALWATVTDLVIRNGPLRRIWLCAMGHCAEWRRTVKICIDFCAMGHSAGFGYALWAIAQGLAICYGP